jgi:hypothetical protein
VDRYAVALSKYRARPSPDTDPRVDSPRLDSDQGMPYHWGERKTAMGSARDAVPVKLIASLLTAEPELITETKEALVHKFGATEIESEIFPFDHTDYYEPEFGPNLQRQIVSFVRLIDPVQLPDIKLRTNELEWSTAEEGRRRVNIDPGYVSLGKLVLATTKDHAHRIYLGQGIYGEVTLTFQRGCFQPWPWTYPDYASSQYCALFDSIRKEYKRQLREHR